MSRLPMPSEVLEATFQEGASPTKVLKRLLGEVTEYEGAVVTWAEAIVLGLLRRAREGNAQAAELVFNRADGILDKQPSTSVQVQIAYVASPHTNEQPPLSIVQPLEPTLNERSPQQDRWPVNALAEPIATDAPRELAPPPRPPRTAPSTWPRRVVIDPPTD